MDNETKSGYVAAFIFIVAFFAFLTSLINIGLNKVDLLSSIITAILGILGFGSLWKPRTIGAVAVAIIDMFRNTGNTEGSSPDSHNKQIQSKSSGSVQVHATHGAKVNVSIPSDKKGSNADLEGKELLWNEKRVIRPSKSRIYQVDLDEGEYLKGEITASHPIDIYLVTYYNYEKWKKGESLRSEYYDQDILETEIDYFIPMDSTWYLILENKDATTPTEVRVRLYEEKEA
jgi:hypothetical protein